MDKEKILDNIFNNDPFNLLEIKPKSSNQNTDKEHVISSFQEINNYFEKHKKEPSKNISDVKEHGLFSRLQTIRKNKEWRDLLKKFDVYNMLISTADHVQEPQLEYGKTKEINSIDDLLNNDYLGILGGDDDTGLFDFKHTPKDYDRAKADFVARRKPCKDFEKYENRFKEVQKELAEGKRKLIDFKETLLKENRFYINNGILLYLESINYKDREWKRGEKENNRIRKFTDGRTRTIFENGTESNMYFRSLAKALIVNGRVVTENTDVDKIEEKFRNEFASINDNDEEAGYIYVLQSKSTNKEICSIRNLYKIGYSKTEVEERIKNAEKEPTYLMAPVSIQGAWKCFNMNPQKLEQLLHNFFGNSCLELDVFDEKGKRHTPREWFIAPIEVIEQAIELIINGEIIHYKFDAENMTIVPK